MIPRNDQPIAFQIIRGGRFTATLSPKAAKQFCDAVATMVRPPDSERYGFDALQARLTDGARMSQGDIASLVQFRPHFSNLGPDARRALDLLDTFLRERGESIAKRPGTPRALFNSNVVLPPRPTSNE